MKCDLSGYFSPLRVPRPSICSNRMRDFTGRRKTMNSRSGMSTPVVSMSTVTTIAGVRPVAELADALQRPVDVGAGDLLRRRTRRGRRRRGQCRRAGRRARCAAGRWRRRSASSGSGRTLLRARRRTLRDFLEDLPVGVGRGDLRARPRSCRTRARLRAGRAACAPVSGSTMLDLFALLEEDAVHADVAT